MMLVARMAPEDYEPLPMMAVAAIVGEWRQAYDHAVATQASPMFTFEVLTHLGDVVEAWRRKRNLPVHTHPAAVVADARAYATERPGELAAFDQMLSGVRSFLTKIEED